MTETTLPNPYLAAWSAFERDGGAGDPAWLAAIRKAGIDRFAECGFPSARDEAWKYTRVRTIVDVPYALAGGTLLAAADVDRIAPFGWELDAHRLVFVNGRFSAALSRGIGAPGGLPAGVELASLRAILPTDPERARGLLERQLTRNEHAFAALNHAFVRDGALIRVKAGVKVAKPIQVVHLSAVRNAPMAIWPRTIVELEEGAEAVFLENYAGLPGGTYLNGPFTDIVVARGARLRHVKWNQESPGAYHVAGSYARVDAGARYDALAITLGSRIARNEIECLLDGAGAESHLNGLYLLRDDQLVDHYTTLDHAEPNCPSDELFKGVLDGRAYAAFRGRIIVRRGCVGTDSVQHNCNLLLSDHATAVSKPQLEIYADDVRCTHGATVGAVDERAVLYLGTRGIAYEEAHDILTFAFARELVDRIPVPALAERMEATIYQWLAQGKRGHDPNS